ncbi:toxin-antitoxin system YwqK family antitoxin [Chitinophagaceae bacterium MMS25-I14]
MRTILTLLLFISTSRLFGQIQLPEYIDVSDRSTHLIRKDSSGYFFTGRNGNIIWHDIDVRNYKLFDKSGFVLAEGGLTYTCIDCIGMDGKWTRYYGNHKLHSVIYYDCGQMSGPVDTFYSNGQLALHYNLIGIDDGSFKRYHKAGIWQEYYNNGQLKEEGLYYLALDSNLTDSTIVTNPETGAETLKVSKVTGYSSQKSGRWTYYDEAGKLLKEENYR